MQVSIRLKPGSDTVDQLFNGTIFQHDCALMLIDLRNVVLKMRQAFDCFSFQQLIGEPCASISNRGENFLDETGTAEENEQSCAVLVLNLENSMEENVLKEGLLGLLSIYGIVNRVELAMPFSGKECE